MSAEVARDFDRIARAIERQGADDQLSAPERRLLRRVGPARHGLDVGCGHGSIVRALASKLTRVTGIDLSPEMVRVARAMSRGAPRVDYLVGDVMTANLPRGGFDVVTSFAMLHHVPLEPAITRLAELVAPGGLLLVQDLLDRSSPLDLPTNAVAWLARRLRPDEHSAEVRQLYEHHGATERYLTMSEVRRIFPSLLPGAEIRHHLEWRYSVIWRKPAA